MYSLPTVCNAAVCSCQYPLQSPLSVSPAEVCIHITSSSRDLLLIHSFPTSAEHSTKFCSFSVDVLFTVEMVVSYQLTTLLISDHLVSHFSSTRLVPPPSVWLTRPRLFRLVSPVPSHPILSHPIPSPHLIPVPHSLAFDNATSVDVRVLNARWNLALDPLGHSQGVTPATYLDPYPHAFLWAQDRVGPLTPAR
jgi:hypothetical protein